MNARPLRTAATGAALGCLLAATGGASAHAATPKSWEDKALGLTTAQQTSKGAGITVAVLDTGVIPNHPALKGRVMETGPNYVEDGHRPGDPKWGRHGTAMASDVLKAAPQAKVLPVRVTSDDIDHARDRNVPDESTALAKGIDYALKKNADVISMSLGDGETLIGPYNTAEADALGRAAQRGVPVLASAGNGGDEDNEGQFPAAYPSVMAVAATDKNGKRAPFSTVRSYVALAAPGVKITSAKNTGGYKPVNGTSPATALASGVVALMLSHNAKLTPDQVRNVLTRTAHHPPGGRNDLIGHGSVNAAAALKASSTPPAAQTGPLAHRGKQHLATPDGTPKTTSPPVHTEDVAVAAGTAIVGLGVLTTGILITRRFRRAT